MPEEENNPAPTPASGQGAGDGNGGNPNPAPEGNGAGAPNTEGDNNRAAQGDKTPAEGRNNDASGDNDDPPVRARKTAKDWIIERKEKKIAKLQEQLQKKGEGADGAGNDDNDGDDSQEDKKFILDTVEPILSPIIEKSLQQEDENELQGFISKNPDFKPYEAKARKFMQHPSRRQLPIQSIFYEVAGPDLMKIGAKRAAEANDRAKQGNTGGGSNRGNGTVPNAWAMSDADFKAMQDSIRQRR